MAGGSSRPGKGSRVPRNVKMRPAPPVEDRAKARRKGTGKNAKDEDSSDEDEDEEDRRAREQFAQDSGDEDGDRDGDHKIGKEDDPRPLEGMLVCSSGQLRAPRDDIKAMCEALGAVFEQVLTTETTFLIADTTESDKYKACVENAIPVIQSSFILELHHRWLELIPCDVVGLSNFLRLPPLQDLTICLTGYEDDRNHHRNMITQSGGAAYSPELTHEVTHLVVGPKFIDRDHLLQNRKYQYAKHINSKREKQSTTAKQPIYIVWGEWLEHCLYAFGRVKEEFYSTDVFHNRNNIKPPPVERSQDLSKKRDFASPSKLRRQKSGSDQAQIRSKRRLTKQETNPPMNDSEKIARKRSATAEETSSLPATKKAKSEPSTGDISPEEGNTEASVLEATGTKEELEPAAVKKQSSSLSVNPLESASNAQASVSRAPIKKQRSSTQMELLGVQDLLVPKAEPPTQALQVTASFNSALPAKAEGLAVVSHAPAGLNGSLLSKMGKERSSKFITKIRESTPNSSEPEASTSKVTIEASRAESMDVLSRSASPVPIAQVPGDEGHINMIDDDDKSTSSPLFEGKRFHVVEGDFDKALRSRITDLMIERGGILSDTISGDSDLVICKTISDQPAPFDLTDTRLVTADWIEACMAFDEIVDDTYLVKTFERPVRCTLPLPGLVERRVCVSYSGFDADYEKPKLISWLDALGIAHEPYIRRKDMEGKLKTTHIIIPDQSYRSQRLGTAQEWGIKVVYPQWIRDMALQHPVSSHARLQSMMADPVKIESADNLETAGPSSDDVTDDDKPLKGCRVHVPRRTEDWRGLERLALTLGARTIQNFDSEMARTATHFIFQSSQAKPTSKDFSLAVQHKVKIVHPDWIRHTAQKGIKQAETSYRHTRSSKRSLEVLVESQGMSKVSSSSSSKSVREAPSSDDYDLPPPLKKSMTSSTPGLARSTPRSIRSPEPPRSKTVSSSSVPPFASTPDRSQTISAGDDQNLADYSTEQHKLDDSGFIPSAGKGKDKVDTSIVLCAPSEISSGAPPADEALLHKKSLFAEMEALLQKDELTPQQLSARLPFQQQGIYQSRTSLRKSVGRLGDSASPNASLRTSAASVGTPEGATLARRQAFKHHDETQFGQHRNEDTQTQAMLEEQTMVIKINDPVAEATKAKTLAEIRRARTAEGSMEDVPDAEATQRSTDETIRTSSRRSRSGQYATRRRE